MTSSPKDISGAPSVESAPPTPMMAQYIEIKAANPDCLLFYRMGDFYEMFFKDAEIASLALGITLTKRGKHQGQDIPMCGVPVHAADGYLQRLIKLDYRVAVCEQTENPKEAKKRGAKSVVRREVKRLVTPGTITEDNLLDARANNYLVSLALVPAEGEKPLALAYADISTGLFNIVLSDAATLATELARLSPKELVCPANVYDNPEFSEILSSQNLAPQNLVDANISSDDAGALIARFFPDEDIDLAIFSRSARYAIAVLLSYIERTQLGERPPLHFPHVEKSGQTMAIDAVTRASLELIRTQSGERKGSLLHSIDRTVTPSGSRLLAQRLSAPLSDPAVINDRLDTVSYFVARFDASDATRQLLKQTPDIERSLTRLALGRGGPRDLAALGAACYSARDIAALLAKGELTGSELTGLVDQLGQAPVDLADLLQSSLASDPPLLRRDGGFVAKDYNADLDELRALRDESRQIIAGLQAQYSQLCEIKSLKIKHNNVLGYFVDMPAQHGEKLLNPPLNETFIHRQTLANAMRFTTTELSGLEAKIASAGERANAIEQEIFDYLTAQVLALTGSLQMIARSLASLDVSAALALLAEQENLTRPQVDDSLAFEISKARHIVVEQALRAQGEASFIANDCSLSPRGDDPLGAIWLLTGPNMGGKSTFLRQNALLAILAQTGAYVPAQSAHIGVVDALFSRVGASDDLAKGRSTFMVEMVETATILKGATSRSLVILDEIGRGTATFDGLSIAWATVEHLHAQNKCRAMFATHYHELTALVSKLDRLQNHTMRVKEYRGDVIFLHEVAPGTADRSYGIQVARLAGLPESVLSRAKSVLDGLESGAADRPQNIIDDLPLFSVQPRPTSDPRAQKILAQLDEIKPDDLSPKQALEALYQLKNSAQDDT